MPTRTDSAAEARQEDAHTPILRIERPEILAFRSQVARTALANDSHELGLSERDGRLRGSPRWQESAAIRPAERVDPRWVGLVPRSVVKTPITLTALWVAAIPSRGFRGVFAAGSRELGKFLILSHSTRKTRNSTGEPSYLRPGTVLSAS